MNLFGNIRYVSANRFFRIATGASFAMIALGVAGIFWQLYPLLKGQPVVPLHYNIHFGVDQVGVWWRLFVPSGIAVILTLSNALYAATVWQREKVIAYAFLVTSLLLNVFVLLHIVFIVLLNLAYV